MKQSNGLFFPWLMLPLQVSLKLLWNIFSREYDMSEFIITLLRIVDESLVYWVPALMLLGYAIKHCSGFPNQLIPIIEIASGVLVGVVYGLTRMADLGTAASAVEVFEYAGQGALIGLIAIGVYDISHGIIKTYLSHQKEEK